MIRGHIRLNIVQLLLVNEAHVHSIEVFIDKANLRCLEPGLSLQKAWPFNTEGNLSQMVFGILHSRQLGVRAAQPNLSTLTAAFRYNNLHLSSLDPYLVFSIQVPIQTPFKSCN